MVDILYNKSKKNIFERSNLFAIVNSILEISSLYVIIELLNEELNSKNHILILIISFCLIQILKILLFYFFRYYAINQIYCKTKQIYQSIKNKRILELYNKRYEDEKAAIEVLTTSQEISNSVYANFNLKSSVISLLFYAIYAILYETHFLELLLFAIGFYLFNKFFISSIRKKFLLDITHRVDSLGAEMGALISNTKFFTFDSNAGEYDKNILQSFNELRIEQSYVNLINISIRPVLELISIVGLGLIILLGGEIIELVSLFVLILKSIPLISQLNFSSSTIELSENLNQSTTKTEGLKPQPINKDWKKIKFKYKGIDFEFSKGEKIYLDGPSGSGKSTLLEMLSGIIKPQFELNVDYKVDNLPTWSFNNGDFKYLNQHIKPWDFSIKRFFNISESKTLEIFFTKSEILRLQKKDISLNQLSGGQFQRFFLFSILKEGCKFLIIDEVLSGVDGERSELIYNYLSKQDLTIIATSHNQNCSKFFEKKWTLKKE